MIQIIKKIEQLNSTIFNGNFLANKPVASGTKSIIKPYSNLFYWSHAIAIDDCEFDLHPHEGFEIMTFIIEGSNEHYDTKTQKWTALVTGDFQIIQSNSGIEHQERIAKGTRAFQIWFDPNFYEALRLNPSYTDYHSKDFQVKEENGIETLTYVGKGSSVKTLTENLTIKKLKFKKQTNTTILLNSTMSYTFYILDGQGSAENQKVEKDDAIRISNATSLDIEFQGELFYIETPTSLKYKPVWT